MKETKDTKKEKRNDKTSKRKKNFSGIRITAGIDAHLWQWNVTIYVGNRLHKTFQQPPCASKLKRYLEENFPGGDYYSGYEAGYFGYVSHRELEFSGIKSIVINASDIPTTDKEKLRKSDKIDSKKIAKSILNREVTGIYIPSEQIEADRRLVRYRTKTVRQELTRCKQRLKSFLVVTGKHREVEGYKSGYWSKQLIQQIGELDYKNEGDILMLEHHLKNLEIARKKFSQANRQICLLYTSPSPRDRTRSRMPSSA